MIQLNLKLRLMLLLVFITPILTSCSSVSISAYQDNLPILETDFFVGKLTAHGVVKNRSGKVTRTFNANMTGEMTSSGVIILTEDFTFNDGEKQQRIWKIDQNDQQNIIASANDVSKPTTMYLAGNSLFMDYYLNIAYKAKNIEVKIIDRMYLVNDQVLINESIIKKWGFRVGSLSLVILKAAS